jgi:hypothetical protein
MQAGKMNSINNFFDFNNNLYTNALYLFNIFNSVDFKINLNEFSVQPNLHLQKENNILANNGIIENKMNFSENIPKRGRKRLKMENKKAIHGSNNFDNIQRKIQVHFLSFLINFCNDALKTEYTQFRHTFKQINYKSKTTVNFNHTSFLKKSSIKDLLNLEISEKYSKYNKFENKKLLDKIILKSKWLNDLFEMNYLKLFDYYYNKEEPLYKIIFENKEILLSSKTKSFYYLLEKNQDLKQEIIDTAKLVYFNGNDGFDNPFPKIKVLPSEEKENP